MSEMVERVRLAIVAAIERRDTSATAARAAIEAMREPTPRMVSDGESAASWGIGKCNDEEALPRVWYAMIDAALKGGL